MNNNIVKAVILILSSASLIFAQAETKDVVKTVMPCVVVIKTDMGQGSGFIISPDGLIVTNHHVIAGAKGVAVKTNGGDIFEKASLVLEDAKRDFAVIRVAGFNLPTCGLGDTSAVEVGQDVIAIGSPLGLEQSVSTGVISAVRSSLGDEELGYRVFQTTAPISPGNSGGPLLTKDGKIIGINTFKLVAGENLNFSVPVDYVQGALSMLSEEEKKGKPWGTLTWEGASLAKEIISFKNLAWGLDLKSVEIQLGKKLSLVTATSKFFPDIKATLKNKITSYSLGDTLADTQVVVYYWFDDKGLTAITLFEKNKNQQKISSFFNDIHASIIAKYGRPSQDEKQTNYQWFKWVDKKSNSIRLNMWVGNCFQFGASKYVACLNVSLYYIRNDSVIRNETTERSEQISDPF